MQRIQSNAGQGHRQDPSNSWTTSGQRALRTFRLSSARGWTPRMHRKSLSATPHRLPRPPWSVTACRGRRGQPKSPQESTRNTGKHPVTRSILLNTKLSPLKTNLLVRGYSWHRGSVEPRPPSNHQHMRPGVSAPPLR